MLGVIVQGGSTALVTGSSPPAQVLGATRYGSPPWRAIRPEAAWWVWSAEPIGAVSNARTPSATGHSQGWTLGGHRSPATPRHKPRATAKAPSRYAVHRTAVTTADDNAMGRSPGAQPRGPRPGFPAEGPAAATSRSRANERANAPARSHPSDRWERGTLMSASGSDGCLVTVNDADGAESAKRERKPDVAILPAAVYLASPVGAGDPVL